MSDDDSRPEPFRVTATPEQFVVATTDGEPVLVVNFAPEEPSATDQIAAPAAEDKK